MEKERLSNFIKGYVSEVEWSYSGKGNWLDYSRALNYQDTSCPVKGKLSTYEKKEIAIN